MKYKGKISDDYDLVTKKYVDNIFRTKTYSNIVVKVTTELMDSYNTWDTEKAYRYSADVNIDGLTSNSMIQNIVLSDTLSSKVADIVQTSSNTLTFYTKTQIYLNGTIITLNTLEV